MTITTYIIISIIKSLAVIFVLLTAVAYSVWLERKVSAHIQNRWGPTRVGPFGLLQPLADGVKFIFKEDLTPPYVYKPLYIAAPVISVVFAITSIAVVPFGNSLDIRAFHVGGLTIGPISTPFQITDLNIGVLVILGITSMGVYGVALAGWSSNSKYSLLGGLRASAQMVSYEVSLGLSLIPVLIWAGSFSLRDIVLSQRHMHWNVFYLPFGTLAFFLYLISAYAETNRTPFDLPEAESELVAGYHTEYSAMKFAMFFMAEYANMVTVACLATLLFFGGWLGPVWGSDGSLLNMAMPVIWFCLKVFFFMFLYVWVRWTLPRFRYDQLMAFGWKVLLPLSIANLVVTALWVAARA
ncbi:MAG TPA: NADH-quinone oxidoreductase subunit NuoH [Terriglobales bacterium]|nr:NADH-quinone oxidoreductase subunit NuoH [Terriglobales bacterium]